MMEDIDPPSESTITAINASLARNLNQKFLTPYIALEAIRKVFATYSVFIPAKIFMDADEGDVTFDLVQFGVETVESTNYVYFAWEMNEEGTFDVFAEVVNEQELEELLKDEDEED